MTFEDAQLETASTPQSDRRYFTVDEANRALTYVRPVVEDITCVYQRIVELRRGIEQSQRADELTAQEREYEQSMDRLSDLVDELQAVGVELKDFEKGLVDFPAVHESREVLLCWHRGEPQVSHWHEVDAGFAGRQPVDLLYQH